MKRENAESSGNGETDPQARRRGANEADDGREGGRTADGRQRAEQSRAEQTADSRGDESEESPEIQRPGVTSARTCRL